MKHDAKSKANLFLIKACLSFVKKLKKTQHSKNEQKTEARR